jgi:hypothetical protein
MKGDEGSARCNKAYEQGQRMGMGENDVGWRRVGWVNGWNKIVRGRDGRMMRWEE